MLVALITCRCGACERLQLNKMFAEYNKPNKKDLRRFGQILGALIAIIFGLLAPFWADRPFPAWPAWPWAVAGILWLWAFVLPGTLYPLHRFWMGLGSILGRINTRIILTILFYCMMVPIGLIMRIGGRDPMARRYDPDAVTYRTASRKKQPESMENPF